MALIAEYVQTAEPVGSRAIARRHLRGLSAATIRNVMADLEEAGYLSQPHTSAGRVPTDKAYRFYVDHLERMPWIMAETPLRLSQRSHMTGMLLAPPLEHTGLDRVELVALADGRALAVIVTETGWITVRAISSRLAAEELREIGRALTRRYRGKTFRQILDDVRSPADPLDPLWTRSRSLLEQVIALLRDRTLYVSGATNFLNHPDFSDVSTMRSLLQALEEKAQLIDLLSRIAAGRGVQVMIGGENPLEEMRECSLVAAAYTYRDQALGVLGIVGPRRMAYSEVISLVDETARLVSDSLSRVKHQLYLPS
jgi:heat-inducible transcriptional repressor